MTTDTTTSAGETTLFLGEAWFDPIEAGIREQIRGFIEGAALPGRRRYELRPRPIWSSGRFAWPREGCFACKSRPSDHDDGRNRCVWHKAEKIERCKREDRM